MSDPAIPWRPRVILPGRSFRLPVHATDDSVTLSADPFETIATRWSDRDGALYHYLRSPRQAGDYTLRATQGGESAETTIRVSTLDDLRRPHTYNGAWWPRRWPLESNYKPTKTRQTLQDEPVSDRFDEETVAWLSSQSDEVLWAQLPGAELPKAHFANCHQGCPNCGTAIFKYSGFYPWVRRHMPCDFKSECPNCGSVYPSNDLANEDYSSGEFPDDGYGFFDAEGHIFLFAATYHRDQCRSYNSGINAMTNALRSGGFDEARARQLGLLLLRYAEEELYVASVPQFRYGPSKGVEEPWDWGQADWADEPDPVQALRAKGSIRYSIDTPYLIESLALAYDTAWPLMREDRELVERAQSLGLSVQTPEDVCQLAEEMLAALLQVTLDRGASSNLPRESQGALIVLRCLDRADGRNVMEWVYDEGPDTLRVFTTNDFFPDGTPQEATGGYNSIHSDGLFDLEHHLRHLRDRQPEAYPESDFPSLFEDRRAAHVPRALHEITMCGKSYFQFGDGSAPGSAGFKGDGTIRLDDDLFHPPMDPNLLERAVAFTNDPLVREIRSAAEDRRHRALGPTVHDGVGIAVLRTPEAPERAAAGIVYGDTLHHRHRDLLDVQLFAFERPFLTDLGYPQSWASMSPWESHWATHNTVWSDLPAGEPQTAGRGRLVRSLFVDGLQVLDVEAHRWTHEESRGWRKLGVTFRRLIALVETDSEGVVLIDLSRITGGAEHWRTCRGLEGEFQSDNAGLHPQTGTVAGPRVERAQTDDLSHPDHTALAYMDDVKTAHAPPAIRGAWRSQAEPAVQLDLHQINVSPGTRLFTARAAQAMGTPEESNYLYHPVLWRRTPQEDTTCVDLVFEPRIADPTLEEAVAVPAQSPSAVGVRLNTAQGRQIAVYWSPVAGPSDATRFEDGVTLHGALAAVVDGRISTVGASAFRDSGAPVSVDRARQTGRIVALDRDACTIDVEGLEGVAAGDRVAINPDERAHSYRVEAVEPVGDPMLRLTLDVTSILGRAKVVAAEGGRIDFGYHILAKSGNLNGTRIQTGANDDWAVISNASNERSWPPGPVRTTVHVDPNRGDGDRLQNLATGAWVQVVDYVVGDTVLFEPVGSGGL